MELLLISKADESQLFILNALTNTLFSFLDEQSLSISLILISYSKVEDNFLFLEKKYSEVEYIKRFNQLKRVEKKGYDYLISIENSLVGLAISAKISAKLKVSFKRAFGFLVFDKLISQKKKPRLNYLSLIDMTNLVQDIFSITYELSPKYYHENPLVQKNHKMIHWIFNTNHSIDLANTKYLLMDIHFGNFQKTKNLEMVYHLCDHLISNFKIKIIFISNQLDKVDQILKSSEKITRENFIHSKQDLNKAIANFPLLNHSSLIVTNKLRVIPFLSLINKPYYLIRDRKILLKLFDPIKYFKGFTKKNIGEISYMLKSL
ncbi:MAG: hypothetical protein CMB82_03955 [Flammeovirgaceae bacterium]|nr:hypothetical protein [Flammeovirgaceae bacterium]|tara:strand:+ start:768 stop:1724 length:957 start_codon:yes stop_codon:yes gene_type:complete